MRSMFEDIDDAPLGEPQSQNFDWNENNEHLQTNGIFKKGHRELLEKDFSKIIASNMEIKISKLLHLPNSSHAWNKAASKLRKMGKNPYTASNKLDIKSLLVASDYISEYTIEVSDYTFVFSSNDWYTPTRFKPSRYDTFYDLNIYFVEDSNIIREKFKEIVTYVEDVYELSWQELVECSTSSEYPV